MSFAIRICLIVFCVCVILVILPDGFVGCDGGDVKSSSCCSDYVVPEIGQFCLWNRGFWEAEIGQFCLKQCGFWEIKIGQFCERHIFGKVLKYVVEFWKISQFCQKKCGFWEIKIGQFWFSKWAFWGTEIGQFCVQKCGFWGDQNQLILKRSMTKCWAVWWCCWESMKSISKMWCARHEL
jgi:hypothetical protein